MQKSQTIKSKRKARQQRRRRQNRNKQIKQITDGVRNVKLLEQEIAAESKLSDTANDGSSNYLEPTRPNYFRKFERKELINQHSMYLKHVRDRYIVGLVHPDLAVKENLQVKMWSDMPIPTASVGWREQYQLTTSNVGTFLLSWRPQFMNTATETIYNSTTGTNVPLVTSQITYNNSSNLNGRDIVGGNVYLDGATRLDISLSRYRCVSAMIRVSYNGPVINQAGVIISSATFDRLPVLVCRADGLVSGISDPLVDRYGQFNNILTGLWNTSVNVTEGGHGVECLFVPMDPSAYMFEDIASYFGAHSNAITATSGSYLTPSTIATPINYVIAGRNLPSNSSCVLVDVFYNFEVIAQPSTAPILRAAVDEAMTLDHHEAITKGISGLIKNGNLIRKATSDKSFGEILGNIAKAGINYLPKLLASIM